MLITSRTEHNDWCAMSHQPNLWSLDIASEKSFAMFSSKVQFVSQNNLTWRYLFGLFGWEIRRNSRKKSNFLLIRFFHYDLFRQNFVPAAFYSNRNLFPP